MGSRAKQLPCPPPRQREKRGRCMGGSSQPQKMTRSKCQHEAALVFPLGKILALEDLSGTEPCAGFLFGSGFHSCVHVPTSPSLTQAAYTAGVQSYWIPLHCFFRDCLWSLLFIPGFIWKHFSPVSSCGRLHAGSFFCYSVTVRIALYGVYIFPGRNETETWRNNWIRRPLSPAVMSSCGSKLVFHCKRC